MKNLVLLTVLVIINSLSSSASTTVLTREKILNFEASLVSQMKENNLSHDEILQKYFFSAQEVAENEDYLLAIKLMEKALNQFAGNGSYFEEYAFLCEMYYRGQQFKNVSTCLKRAIPDNNARSEIINEDIDLYIDFQKMRVLIGKRPYEKLLSSKDLNLIGQNSRLEEFDMLNLVLYFKRREFKRALSLYKKIPELVEDQEYAIYYDFLLFKTKSKSKRQCRAIYEAYADIFNRKLPLGNSMFKICDELSKKYPSESRIRNLLKLLDHEDLKYLIKMLG